MIKRDLPCLQSPRQRTIGGRAFYNPGPAKGTLASSLPVVSSAFCLLMVTSPALTHPTLQAMGTDVVSGMRQRWHPRSLEHPSQPL
eukprot:1842960-Amphidinium_carterae.1